MDINTKIFLVVCFLLLDLIVVFIPLASVVIAIILISKPKWFKEFVDEFYQKQ